MKYFKDGGNSVTTASVGWSAEMDSRVKMIRKDPETYLRQAKRGALGFGTSIVVSPDRGASGSARKARGSK